MQATQFATLADEVRKLPAPGAGRDRRLHRLTDLYAFAEAAAALQAAAARTREGVLGSALASARVLLGGDPEERDALRDDSAARDSLLAAVTSQEFLALVPAWIRELRQIAARRPETGACTLASSLELWSWTMDHFRTGQAARGDRASQAVDELAAVLCPLLASRYLILEVTGSTPSAPTELRTDLCGVQAARSSAVAATECAELVFGYRRHLGWDAEGCAACYAGEDLDDLESVIPGIASGTRANGDVVEADGSHAAKAGPCVRFDGVETFVRLRDKLDGCLTGARFARDRAAAGIARSMAAMTGSEGKA